MSARRNPSAADRLAQLPAPGEGPARARAWALAAAAHAERPRRSRRRRRALLLAPATAILLAAGLTPPGEAVAEWVGRTVRDVVAPAPPRPAALGALPGGGRLLVQADGGAPFVVGDVGRRQVLGAVGEATWSGHGHFVAATRGHELIAVDLAGRRRWSVTASAAVRAPRWSPDGFRVAYFAGPRLHVVAGDGTADRLLALAVPVPVAWRPGPGHVLAHADTHREVVVVDADRGAVVFRTRGPRAVRALAFSPGGDRLVVVGAHEVRVLDARSGRLIRRLRAPAGAENARAAFPRHGRDFALVRRRGARSEVLLVGPGATRRLFAAGALGAIAFSPRGDWLLVDWRETGSWLFLPVGGPRSRRPRQITGVGRRFGGRAAAPAGWCCPPS